MFRNFNWVYMAPEGGEAPTGGTPGGTPSGEAPTDTSVEQNQTPITPTGVTDNVEQTNNESQESQLPKNEDKSKVGQVKNLVEQSGLNMQEVAEYAKTNDGQVDLDTMVALKEKHGDAIASLIADQIKSIHKENSEAASKRDTEVFDQVKDAFKDVTDQSGEETWNELATWSKDNVSTEHRKEINSLLAQGGLAAKLAVQELVSAFKEGQGTPEFQDADLIEADSAAQASTGGNISKSDYNRELNELLNKGHVYGDSAEIRKLDARRAKTLARGR